MFSRVSHPGTLEQRVLTCLRQNALVEARLLMERLPKSACRFFLEGWLLFRQGKIDLAAASLSAYSQQSPFYSFSLLQKELKGAREEERFLMLLRAGEHYAPDSPVLSELRALSLLQLGFPEKAESLLRQKISLSPNSLSLQNALATVLGEQGCFTECLELLENLSKSYPNHWEPMNNLACMLNNIGYMDDAIDLYRRAIMMAPTIAPLRLNHSIALLKAGRFAQGWNEHEWRLKLPGHTSLPYERILPNLSHDSHLNGRTVLVTQEEGLGDTLMYLRYLPLLAAHGARVHVWGSRELANITQNIKEVHTVQVGGKRPPYDYHCPFISLPRVFNGIPHEYMGTPVPYLRLSSQKQQYWQHRITKSSDSSLRIGLVWAGKLHQNDRSSQLLNRHRSMQLSELSPLFDIQNVTFYNLQKGPPASQLHDKFYPIMDFMPDCHDMEDTGALIQSLDLIISVDTSIVHLAGGLGKPVFMMDRFCNCWRWGYKTSSSPWYPSLRIFRQERFDHWATVIENVKTEIQNLIRQKA